jgi:hypothetical protein
MLGLSVTSLPGGKIIMESPPASDFPKQIKKKSGSTLVPGPKIRSNQAISVALHRTAYLSMVK